MSRPPAVVSKGPPGVAFIITNVISEMRKRTGTIHKIRRSR